MGVYSTIHAGNKEGQVKLWNDHEDMVGAGLTIRSDVPSVDSHDHYAIAMREGGFVLVYDCKIIAWMDELPADYPHPVYDKWGDKWEGDELNKGLLEEPYR